MSRWWIKVTARCPFLVMSVLAVPAAGAGRTGEQAFLRAADVPRRSGDDGSARVVGDGRLYFPSDVGHCP